MTLAPIILFTYNRPDHTRITLEYLSKCDLFNDSILYVFCDGPRLDASVDTIKKIERVQQVLKNPKWSKNIVLERSTSNKGLYKNVTTGVDKVIKKHQKCIVIEDDLKIGKGFLSYMNEALNTYQADHRIMQVSGFIFPIDIPKSNSTLFLPLSNTIGWGTWQDRWEKVDFRIKDISILDNNKVLRKEFNLGGVYNYYHMLKQQIDSDAYGSWGVLFWYEVFKSRGVCVYPDYSFIQHNDFDHSGVHASDDAHYNYENWNKSYEVTNFEQLGTDQLFSEFIKVKRHLKSKNTYSLRNILIKCKTLMRNFNG